MPILKNLFGKEPKLDKIGNVKSVCPHCDTHLEKRPARKKKCPHCGNYIYVRTRPADRRKVLVTEKQAIQIDEQWMVFHGTYEAHIENKKVFDDTKKELTKRIGMEPSDRDVWWSIYNKKFMEHAKQGNWGLYRNTRLDMAELLRKEGKKQQALEIYVDVSYLDSNGPRNLGGHFDYELLREFPMFDRSLALQAPGIVNEIRRLASELVIQRGELKDLYLKIAERSHKNLKTPVGPGEAWNDLIYAMEK